MSQTPGVPSQSVVGMSASVTAPKPDGLTVSSQSLFRVGVSRLAFAMLPPLRLNRESRTVRYESPSGSAAILKCTRNVSPVCSSGTLSNAAVKGGSAMVALAARSSGRPPTHTAFAAVHLRTGSVSVTSPSALGRTIRTQATLLHGVLRRAFSMVPPVTSRSESRTVT